MHSNIQYLLFLFPSLGFCCSIALPKAVLQSGIFPKCSELQYSLIKAKPGAAGKEKTPNGWGKLYPLESSLQNLLCLQGLAFVGGGGALGRFGAPGSALRLVAAPERLLQVSDTGTGGQKDLCDLSLSSAALPVSWGSARFGSQRSWWCSALPCRGHQDKATLRGPQGLRVR